ncbi:hypothetical protein GALMADRAFT_250782 [Galerina marginata CBS 339.88]|uniref:Cytochrome P450 n=1 Tax=Galerina marginata (strain CBS 339.88) TaxID=685588 RepID=A0A067T4W3_GALM3|nr:hypothetical protein GALMADRAFT_250782 [Galerina marginata CBS 339.88]
MSDEYPFYVLVSVFAILLSTCVWFLGSRLAMPPELRSIPTIGPSGPLFSYIGALRLLFDSDGVFQEGYKRQRNSLFKVADFRSWVIIVSGPRYIDDIIKSQEEVLAFEAAIDEALHTLLPNIRRSHLHVPIIRHQLTRELNDSFPDIQDEVTTAFNELLADKQDDMAVGWAKIPALDTALEVVFRTAHRMFVGLPLCRDPDYKGFNMRFAVDISKAASLIRLCPPWLKPLVGRLFANAPEALRRTVSHLRPLVEERRRNIERYGKNYPGKPEDILSWFMDEVDGNNDEEKLTHLAFHILTVNFGAVYTIAMSFTQALYHLAACPEYVEPLREEIESVLSLEGSTKSATVEMRKLDSFLKESQRLNGLAAASTYRKVLKPFTFWDGTVMPPGVILAVAAHSTHLDDDIYQDAKKFDGFRFANRKSDLDDTNLQNMVTPSLEFLPFGVGRHHCPGRFFTVVILKVMMMHIITNYDVKLEKEGQRPPDSWFSTDNLPNSSAKVLLTKRKSQGHGL